MSVEPKEEPKAPLFDVVITVPPGRRLEDIQKLARDAGVPSDRIDRLMQVLRAAPNAKVGASVSAERAAQEKELFSKAGLNAEITPVLGIQAAMAGSYDGLDACPSCGQRVTLSTHRQCPNCGVYVDKLTDEYLLRKKMMQQERGAIEFQKSRAERNAEKSARDSVEAALRASIRAEMEKKYGDKQGVFSGKAGAMRAGAAVALLAIAFVGGKNFSPDGLPGGFSWGKSASAKSSAMSAESLQKVSLDTSKKGEAVPGAEGAEGAAYAGGDADLDDPLIQSATGGKKMGGKGLTIEQAVAAAQTLAKSVGNTTGQGSGGGGAATAGETAAVADGAKPEGAGATAADSSQGGVVAASVPKQTKQVLTAEFSTLLAEFGQTSRSREVIKALSGSIGSGDAEAAAALRAAELKSQAWSLQRMNASQAGKAAESLKMKALALSDPVERTRMLGNIASILSRSPQLPPEAARLFLALGAESLKSVGAGPELNATLGDLAVSMAEVFSNEASARAKSGMWTTAQAAAVQIDNLVRQAPDEGSQSRLYAVDYQVQLQLGNNDKAAQSLNSALGQVEKAGGPLEQAIRLRSIARLSDAAAGEQVQAVTDKLQSQLAAKSGMEKARVLTQLSLLYASAGMPGKSTQYREMAQSTTGLSAAESTAINTDLLVRGDMAMARVLQGLGRYAEAEALLQRVGGYLF